MAQPVPIAIGLGSNIQPREHTLAGMAELTGLFHQVEFSVTYESPAVGFTGPPFYNLVALTVTQASPADLQAQLKELEYRWGRSPKAAKYASRTLDLDLLLYGNLVQPASPSAPALPRSDTLTRAFVLRPLAELRPYWRHPVTGQTYRQHWQEFAGDRTLQPVSLYE